MIFQSLDMAMNIVNTLQNMGCRAGRLHFNLSSFDKGDYQKAVEEENLAK